MCAFLQIEGVIPAILQKPLARWLKADKTIKTKDQKRMRKKEYTNYETLPDGQFKTLVDIVCRHYNADPRLVLGGNHSQAATIPRNIIATIWSRGATLQETSDLVGWKSCQQVCHARKRVAAIAERPSDAFRLRAILAEIFEKIPFLVIEND